MKQMAKNDTRIASEHGLLTSEARVNMVVKVDCMMHTPKWTLTEEEWRTHAEFEGVLHLTQLASTEAQ